MEVKSGRFMYQSERAGDEAKKRKSPAKSGRVGITVTSFNKNNRANFCGEKKKKITIKLSGVMIFFENTRKTFVL